MCTVPQGCCYSLLGKLYKGAKRSMNAKTSRSIAHPSNQLVMQAKARAEITG